jgi:hypothetical protein
MRNAGTPIEGMPLGSCEVGDAARTPDPHVLREEVRADHKRSRERLSGYAPDSREEREPQSDPPRPAVRCPLPRERCPSGLRSATGNRVRAERCVAGSNPALSADGGPAPERTGPPLLATQSFPMSAECTCDRVSFLTVSLRARRRSSEACIQVRSRSPSATCCGAGSRGSGSWRPDRRGPSSAVRARCRRGRRR